MPTLIILCGTSFAGKSTLARLLTERFGYPEVDVDVTKTAIFGDDVADENLSPADWERIYRETDRQIADHLRADRSVIDASRNVRGVERRSAKALGERYGAIVLAVHVETPEHITRQRLLANRQTRARRDVTDADFDAILAAWEPPAAGEHPVIFRFGDDAAEWMTRNASLLTNR